MIRIILVALVTMALATPLAAQQEGGAGQEGAGAGQAVTPGEQGMTQDTSAAAGATDRTSETTTTETPTDTGMDDEGGAMPTTASTLPLALVGGALLVAVGIGLRLARRS